MDWLGESDYIVLEPAANIQECQLRPVVHDCTQGQHSEILEISVTAVFTPHELVSPRKVEWFLFQRGSGWAHTSMLPKA